MNTPTINTIPLIGEQFGGGIFAGIILVNDVPHRLIVSPAALGAS